MTQKEFIKVLKEEGYSYEIEGDKIIVTHRGHRGNVYLGALTSLPPGVEFRNGWYIYLNRLTSLPPGMEFKNGGDVLLRDLIGGYFKDWEGNIKGIKSKRLLNKMIKDGMFI